MGGIGCQSVGPFIDHDLRGSTELNEELLQHLRIAKELGAHRLTNDVRQGIQGFDPHPDCFFVLFLPCASIR